MLSSKYIRLLADTIEVKPFVIDSYNGSANEYISEIAEYFGSYMLDIKGVDCGISFNKNILELEEYTDDDTIIHFKIRIVQIDYENEYITLDIIGDNCINIIEKLNFIYK